MTDKIEWSFSSCDKPIQFGKPQWRQILWFKIKRFLWRIFHPARYNAYVISRYQVNRAFSEAILGSYAEIHKTDYVEPISPKKMYK